MSNFYSNGSQFQFVDSQYGTAATSTGIKVNVPIITDIKYHKKVQVKVTWATKGLIGADTFAEGNYESTNPGYPVIRKTDFQGKKGDTIKMHQRTNLAITKNVGMVGSGQLVNAEVGWDMNYKLVKIEQWRQAVLTVGAMNEQRNPVDEPFVVTEDDLLSDWTAQVMDTGLFAALHYGHAYHLFRMFGHTNLPPSAIANLLIGNDTTLTTTRTVADLVGGTTDMLSGASLRVGETYMKENYFDPVSIQGDQYWVVLVSARGWNALFQDSEFRLSMQYARERGIDNPLFKNSGAVIYSNCLVVNSEKIKSVLAALNPASLTVANAGAYNSTITEASYTGIGGGLETTDLHQTYFLGANALALAEGRMRMGDRKEDDYGQFIGRDADNIWGASRMDYYDATGTFANNQSALLMINSLK
jgi:hypothetical protein